VGADPARAAAKQFTNETLSRAEIGRRYTLAGVALAEAIVEAIGTCSCVVPGVDAAALHGR